MFRFIPPSIPHNIFVIGAGGTGGRLMPMLAQFIKTITRGKSPSGWVENPIIWVIDDDIVEHKNLIRQNFIERDIGKPKAVVLAERYSTAYDVPIVPIVKKVTTSNGDAISAAFKMASDALNIRSAHAFKDVLSSSMVIMCVDSVEARRHILNVFSRSGDVSSTFFIDAGNEDSFGQVSMFNCNILIAANEYTSIPERRKLPKLIPATIDTNIIPMPVKYYQQLLDTPNQGSCADLNQTLAINAIMATTIMGIVQNYFYNKPMTFNTISISLDGGNSTTYNTFNNWKDRSLLNQNEYYLWGEGSASTVEKDGVKTVLSFGRYCTYHSFNKKIYLPLRKILDEQEAERVLAEQREMEERARAARLADEEFKRKLADEESKRKLEEFSNTTPAILSPTTPVPPIPPLQAMPRAASTRTRRVMDLPIVNVPVAADTSPHIDDDDDDGNIEEDDADIEAEHDSGINDIDVPF